MLDLHHKLKPTSPVSAEEPVTGVSAETSSAALISPEAKRCRSVSKACPASPHNGLILIVRVMEKFTTAE